MTFSKSRGKLRSHCNKWKILDYVEVNDSEGTRFTQANPTMLGSVGHTLGHTDLSPVSSPLSQADPMQELAKRTYTEKDEH